MQRLQNCIGPTIRIVLEIRCLPYAGFFLSICEVHLNYNKYLEKRVFKKKPLKVRSTIMVCEIGDLRRFVAITN